MGRNKQILYHPGETRIAIVGAGAAGLGAACYLSDKGYRNITILEREDCPGGKCLSFGCQGKTYDLGAVFGIDAYHETLALMRRVGLIPSRSPKRKRTRVERNLIDRGYYPTGHAFPGYISFTEAARLLGQILRYRRLASEYSRLYRAGLDHLPEELKEPFSRWVKKHTMREFAKMVEIPFTTFGYGYFDEVPAAYVLKYMDIPTIMSIIFQRRSFTWHYGAQVLWQKTAEKFDVRYGISVQKVGRSGNITIHTDVGPINTDALILTGPLDEALTYLDAEEAERNLFSKIRHYDYHVCACLIDRFPIPGGFIPANFGKARRGYPMIWSCRWSDNDLYTFYTLGGDGIDDPVIHENLKSEIEAMGGQLREVYRHKKWKYFPHVDSMTMKSGYYEKLEALQGKKNTFFAGELLSFSSIEHTLRYSRSLVDRFF